MPPNTMTGRRVLGDMSPNMAPNKPSITADLKQPFMHSSKPIAGSPLKRSYTTMAGEEQGFMYLKPRRLSADKPLSQLDRSMSQGSSRSVFAGVPETEAGGVRFRPLEASAPAMEAAVCEPLPLMAHERLM